MFETVIYLLWIKNNYLLSFYLSAFYTFFTFIYHFYSFNVIFSFNSNNKYKNCCLFVYLTNKLMIHSLVTFKSIELWKLSVTMNKVDNQIVCWINNILVEFQSTQTTKAVLIFHMNDDRTTSLWETFQLTHLNVIIIFVIILNILTVIKCVAADWICKSSMKQPQIHKRCQISCHQK
jgi:hypothetical protein